MAASPPAINRRRSSTIASSRRARRPRASWASSWSPQCPAIRCSSPRLCRTGFFRRSFNCYEVGDGFGTHVDNAIRVAAATGARIRTDVSATLFLSEPSDYDGGELVVEDTYGTHSVKLPAGSIVLYPASSLHHVKPITRGRRIASFFWIQSMVRDDGQRALLFDLDSAIRRLGADHPAHPSVVQLTGVYHNLLRSWAEV